VRLPGIGKSTLAFAVAERWTGPAMYQRVADGGSPRRLRDPDAPRPEHEPREEPGAVIRRAACKPSYR
jgi:hypothetical protein